MNIIRYLINMKRHYALLLVALMALTAGTAHAITREQLAQYASSLKGKKKAELKTALYQLMNNGKRVLSYGSGNAGTWWGFYVTDRDPETNSHQPIQQRRVLFWKERRSPWRNEH